MIKEHKALGKEKASENDSRGGTSHDEHKMRLVQRIGIEGIPLETFLW